MSGSASQPVIEVVKAANKPAYKRALRIREIVFIREQGVSATEEYDENEKEAVHYLAFYDGNTAGTARWRKTDRGIKLERFAVLKVFRSMGIASALLKEILKEVLPLEEEVYLHAQKQVVKFYEKRGFIVSGRPFTEAGIEHKLMVYKS